MTNPADPEPRTRTPRLNPYIITIDIPDGDLPAMVLVEAHSITEARAWFVDHMLTVERADHRAMHFHGAAGTPLFNAHEPIGPQAELFAAQRDALDIGPDTSIGTQPDRLLYQGGVVFLPMPAPGAHPGDADGLGPAGPEHEP